jgi:16S rRNA (adenine1518-N6/adenine1519-N6)-dimethyltransferase
MLQKEVADRLTAKPGNKTFSKLTIMFGTFMNSEHLFDVPAAAFKPRPKVVSSVVRIIPKNDNQILVNDPIILEKIVTSAFTQRRKTLRNSLKGIISDKIMQELDINPNQRAEELPIPVWTKLANKLTE